MGDHADVERLLYTYAERIDRGDFAGVGDLFRHGRISTEDGTVLATGPAEVEALYVRTTRRYEDDGTPHTKHVTTNTIIDLDGSAGRATARSYFTVLQGLPDFPVQTIISGRYHDSFERIGESWWFREHMMLPDLFGDLSHHLLIEL